jgi:protein-histidine pros-kinase
MQGQGGQQDGSQAQVQRRAGAGVRRGIGVSAWVSHRLLQDNAKEEVLRNAGLMMEAALAIRGYTVSQVKPRIEHHLADEFMPQSVPAYAAAETFKTLRKKYPDFSYKEATLNPTNPANRTVEWRATIVNHFRNAGVSSGRSTASATPLPAHALHRAPRSRSRIPRASHATACPAAAPASMIKLYGESNGFGWKHMEVIGAQVVSVPMTLPIHNANEAFKVFMGSLAAIFVVTFIVLNLMLSVMIIRPISRMSASADKISTGDFNVPEFQAGKDEIGVLGTSFNRMRRSLAKALKLIER